jgi:iron(III) transport system permease protein
VISAAPRRGLRSQLRRRPGQARAPAPLMLAAVVCAAAAAVPLVYLAIVIAGSPSSAGDAIWRPRTAELLIRSLGLALAVAVTSSTLAVTLAWLTVRTDLPGRRWWALLTVLPFVVPSYIGAYLFVSALGPGGVLLQVDWIYGFRGAWLVLTLFTYPLVLLPVRAAMRRLDPSLEEAARGMGRSPLATFTQITLPQLTPAIGAGALLAALYTLSDFGAVSILRFDSFTRVIHQSYRASFDRTGAAALAGLLVLVMLLLSAWEARVRRPRSAARSAPGTARPPAPVALGRWRVPALAFCTTIVSVALVVPVLTLVVWSRRAVAGDPDWGAILAATGNSLLTASLVAAAAIVVALPVALLAARHPGRATRVVEAVSSSGYVLPGIVIALALVFVGTRVAPWAYQTLVIVVFAMVVHFLPLALGSMRTALLQIPRSVEEAGRSAGRGPLGVWATITTPLAMGGTLAGGALVFLTAVKELPTLILLAPTGFQTLATEIWTQTNASVFEAGAVPALVLLLVSAPPLFLLVGRD